MRRDEEDEGCGVRRDEEDEGGTGLIAKVWRGGEG